MSKCLIVALEYLEPDWQETKACIEASGYRVVYVSRDGVGNMARAFNSALNVHIRHFDYLFFATNVTFTREGLDKLVEAMDKSGYAAIHPAMRTSDHRHQHPDGSGGLKDALFIEWTAPIVRTNIFIGNQLDESLPYFYFDLDWSYRVRQQGHKVGVHHGAEVGHTYLRKRRQLHPITNIRRQLREYWTPISRKHMEAKYGKGWEKLMNWK